MSVLEVEDELDWNPNAPTISSMPLSIYDDGAILYYKYDVIVYLWLGNLNLKLHSSLIPMSPPASSLVVIMRSPTEPVEESGWKASCWGCG